MAKAKKKSNKTKAELSVDEVTLIGAYRALREAQAARKVHKNQPAFKKYLAERDRLARQQDQAIEQLETMIYNNPHQDYDGNDEDQEWDDL